MRLPSKIRVPLEKFSSAQRGWRLRRKVRARNFSVIACNCWGAEIYRDLRLPYLTPFVGLYLHSADFVGFLENFDEALRAPLEFVRESRHKGRPGYPVGLIMGQYEIHFVHYESEAEALEKWTRRAARVVASRDDCFLMFCEMFDTKGQNSPEDMRRFRALDFPHKVFFAARPLREMPEAIVVPPQGGGLVTDDGPILYRRGQRYFDLARWLNKKG